MHSAKMTLFSVPLLYPTSGIHGGYRLVSTYDLPDSKPTEGGGVLYQVKTQSGKICRNFNGGGGGGTLPSQNSKWQDLPKFQFWGGGGYSTKSKLKVARSA